LKNNGMRILITGGAGFIGSHLADKFIQEGWSVRVMDNLHPRVHPGGVPLYLSSKAEFVRGDVTNSRDWERALEGVDVVSHQAAYQDYVPDFSEFIRVNVQGTALLFEVIANRNLPVQKVVVASSQAVYGEGQYSCRVHGRFVAPQRRLEDLQKAAWDIVCPQCGAIADVELLHEDYPCPLSPYGVSKYAQEMTALRLAAYLQIPCVALRYSITQGPRQSLFNQYSGIARIFALRLLNGEAPFAFEDGLLQRDYIHVLDVVDANWLVTNDPHANAGIFNVGSGVATTVLEYAMRLAQKLATQIQPEIPGVFRRGDARHSVSSIEKLKSLGWVPRRNLERILGDFVDWARSFGSLEPFMSNAQDQLLKMNVLRMSYGH
jgi:dTDP-L-rhamnose 4-epimerase